MTEELKQGGNENPNEEQYIGNIWGKKYTVYAAIFVAIIFSIATCRYIMIKPDKLIHDDKVEQFIN